MVEEEEKCKFCGRVVKTHTFKKMVKDTERK
jgi:hypothetical protein